MITFFLATVLGWFLVILGLFLLFRHDHIKVVLQDVMGNSGLFFVFALLTVILGLLMVISHNFWLMGWPVVVTILGWLVLVSGLLRLICPETAVKIGQSFVSQPIRMQIAGVVWLIIGLFLLFHVYYLHG